MKKLRSLGRKLSRPELKGIIGGYGDPSPCIWCPSYNPQNPTGGGLCVHAGYGISPSDYCTGGTWTDCTNSCQGWEHS